MSRFRNLAHNLYAGDISFDFIGRRRIWYIGSGAFVLVSILSLLIVGIKPSIDFKGGTQFEVRAPGHTIADAQAALREVNLGGDKSVVQYVGSGSQRRIRITTPVLTQNAADPANSQQGKVQRAIAQHLGVASTALNPQTVGSTWGSEITKKAVEALIVFLILVVVYLSFRFERKMAFAAIIALLHDLIITAGLYSLVGFEVSPSTVVALLTILGYSLYDTVVVFDKVRENTQGLRPESRMTFSEAANLGVNQTLVRSINTSVIALLPVAGLLFIGVYILGAGTLKDLSLALLIGLATGAYSSIFIATPLACDLREREPDMKTLARKVQRRRALEAQAVTAGAAGGGTNGDAAVSQAVLDDAEAEPAAVPGRASGGSASDRPRPATRAQQQRRRPGGRPGGPKRRR